MDTWFWILGRSLTIVTVIGNGFIIFLVCRTRRLRTKTNAFFVSLAVANFCVGLSAVPSLFVCEKTTGCDPEAPFADRVDYLRWLFTYASITNLCSLVLDRYIAVVKPLKYLLFMTRKRVSQLIFFLRYCQFLLCPDVLTWLVFIVNISVFVINSWIIMIIFEILPCCGLIFSFGSMLHVVYGHERAACILAKQLRFNHRYFLKNEEKTAVKVMAIVIGLFLV